MKDSDQDAAFEGALCTNGPACGPLEALRSLFASNSEDSA